jgi:protein-tyrosine phosphatase
MIDIHCHPLPETDDGAASFDVAVEMLKMAATDGVTHVVATPHCNYRYEFNPQENQCKASKLQAAVGEQPKILLGCDFRLSYENLGRLAKEGSSFSIHGSRYLLVEFNDHFIPDQMDQVFYDIQVIGFTPVMTHPERNPVFKQKPEILYRWVSRGCLAQITAMSYTGGFGRTAQRLTEKWLDENLIHFFASDAHDTKRRPPILSHCYRKLAEAKGEQVADLIMKQNPKAVIEGKPLPPNPAPIGPKSGKGKKGVFSFLRRGNAWRAM